MYGHQENSELVFKWDSFFTPYVLWPGDQFTRRKHDLFDHTPVKLTLVYRTIVGGHADTYLIITIPSENHSIALSYDHLF